MKSSRKKGHTNGYQVLNFSARLFTFSVTSCQAMLIFKHHSFAIDLKMPFARSGPNGARSVPSTSKLLKFSKPSG